MDAIRVCPNCQASISETSEFCPQCGQKIEAMPAQATPPAAQSAPPAQSKKLKKRWFVLGGGLILLAVCACLAIGGWFFGDQILEMAGIDLWGMLPDSLPGLGSKTVKGEYQPSEGEASIQYSISKDGVATFLDGERELTASITADKKASVAWNNLTLDGDGALTADEQAALEDFSEGELGEALLVLPFNLACKQGADRPTAEQMAALLVPLQMHLKYAVTDRWAEVQRLVEMSDCPQVIAGSAQNADDEEPPLFEVSPSSSVPFVMGYFPFDEKGSVEAEPGAEPSDENSSLNTPALNGSAKPASICAPAASLTNAFLQPFMVAADDDDDDDDDDGDDGDDDDDDDDGEGENGKLITHPVNELGDCSAKCRGACGMDCTTTNCTESTGERCLVDKKTKKNTGYKEPLIIYTCGVHTGCVWHDGCYDACNEQYGCDSWMAFYCMHGSLSSCDEQACYDHGVGNCQSWARGYGPFERQEVFQYSDLSNPIEPDLVTCPIEVNLAVTPDSVNKGVMLQPYTFEWKVASELPDFIENLTLEWDFGGASTKDNPSSGEINLTREEAAAGGKIKFAYNELGSYDLTLKLIDNDRSIELVTKTVPVVIDQMYDLSGYWFIENGEVISNNITCTGKDETDPLLFPLLGTLMGDFGSFTREAASGEYTWNLNAAKLPPGTSPGDVIYNAKAVQSADGVALTTHSTFPQSSSSSLPLSPQTKQAAAGIGLAAIPILPLAWLGVRRKSRALLAGALLLCLLAAGCSGFIVMYGTVDSQVTFKTIEQTNNTQLGTITFNGGSAPEGLYRLSDGVAHYTVDFTIGGGVATIEGEEVETSHCTGTIDTKATGYVYQDLTVIFPEDDDD